jgi:hypothetical protein
MLLGRIQRDLFEFAKQEDPEDFGPLANFWYRANAPVVSAALTAHPGLKLIVDVPSTRSLDQLLKKLLLLADTVVLRGLTGDEAQRRAVLKQLTPVSGYVPGYLSDVTDDLKKIRPSPLTMSPPIPYWTSTTKTLKGGLQAAYAIQMGGGAPQDIIG